MEQNQINTQTLRITRNGKIDLMATYMPVYREKLMRQLDSARLRVDDFFENH